MIHSAKLNTEHIVEDEIITESESYLNEHGYKTDCIAYYTIVNQKPEDENSGYIVKEVETTAVPFDVADVVQDKLTILICSCASYRYGRGIEDLEDRQTLEWHACKHCESVDKTLKADQDASQTTL